MAKGRHRENDESGNSAKAYEKNFMQAKGQGPRDGQHHTEKSRERKRGVPGGFFS